MLARLVQSVTSKLKRCFKRTNRKLERREDSRLMLVLLMRMESKRKHKKMHLRIRSLRSSSILITITRQKSAPNINSLT